VDLELSPQILEKYSNNRFHENPSSGNGVVSWGRRDARTDRQTRQIWLSVSSIFLKRLKAELFNAVYIYLSCDSHYKQQLLPSTTWTCGSLKWRLAVFSPRYEQNYDIIFRLILIFRGTVPKLMLLVSGLSARTPEFNHGTNKCEIYCANCH